MAADSTAGIGVYPVTPTRTRCPAVYSPQLVRTLKTRLVFSASTLDQMPKQVACGYLYGNPSPSLSRIWTARDHLVIIGANPLVSNGSVATAADFPASSRRCAAAAAG